METYDDMAKLSIEELKKRYDYSAKNTSAGLGFYREEIGRRETDKMNADMLSMTKHMRNMTIAISIMTLANVIAVVIQLCK